MKLNDYKIAYEESSGQLGDINRNLIYTGFGLIWLFGGKEDVLSEYFLPTIFLLLAAFVDLLQYVLKTLIWYFEFRKIEKSNSKDYETDHQHKVEYTYPIWTIFWLKIIFVIIAYILIFIYLLSNLHQ
ncbi:MAG: hypothetical protein WAU01_05445 [Saprospiraceae bacterium]